MPPLQTLIRLSVLTLSVSLVRCATTTTTITVDNADSRIQYKGVWVMNPISDPENFNVDGTLSATNASGATAAFTFSGAIQIAVYGSFPVAGVFSMESRYSIDGINVTTFLPPDTINHPQYRERFFLSNMLTTGTHELVIENAGQMFYFDYIALVQAPTPSIAASATPVAASTQGTTHASPSQAPPPVSTPTATASATGGSIENTQTSSAQITGPTAQSETLTSMQSGTNSAALTPSDSAFTSASSISSIVVSSSGTSSQTAALAQTSGSRPAFVPAVYAAIGVGCLLIIVIVVGGIVCLRRRSRPKPVTFQRVSAITPYDPALTSLSSEEREFDARNRGSGTSFQTAPPYTHLDEQSSTASTTGLRGTDEERGEHTREPGYHPLASPSCASPLVPHRNSEGGRNLESSPIYSPLSPSAHTPVLAASPVDIATQDASRRRSEDGGVRLAGGPPELGRVDSLVVRRPSLTSTLPPLYEPYGTAAPKQG